MNSNENEAERPIDVCVLMLGIDADARPEVQRAMNDIASSGDSGTPAGLVQMLREAISVLRGVEASWTHAAALNASPMRAAEAETRFVEAAQGARARFEHELIRNVDGHTSTSPTPELPDRSGVPGIVVVTFVVAARGELRDVGNARDRGELASAFDALVAVEPKDFVAMEVIWSPAAEEDRATEAQIEAKYPELIRLEAPLA